MLGASFQCIFQAHSIIELIDKINMYDWSTESNRPQETVKAISKKITLYPWDPVWDSRYHPLAHQLKYAFNSIPSYFPGPGTMLGPRVRGMSNTQPQSITSHSVGTTGVSLNSSGSASQGGLLKGDALLSSSRRTRGLVGEEGARRIKELETGEEARFHEDLETGKEACFHEDCQGVMRLWVVRELSQGPERTKCEFNPEGNWEPRRDKKSRVLQVCRMAAESSQVGLSTHKPSWDVPPSDSLSWPGLWRKTSAQPQLRLLLNFPSSLKWES